MLILIDKHSGLPIFRQIMDQIKQQVLTGRLAEGEAVSSVKDLARDIGVNPMTISKAYSLLESQGFLERRRGVGMFAIRPKQALSDQGKLDAIRESLIHVVVQAIHLGLTPGLVIKALKEQFVQIKPEKE